MTRKNDVEGGPTRADLLAMRARLIKQINEDAKAPQLGWGMGDTMEMLQKQLAEIEELLKSYDA